MRLIARLLSLIFLVGLTFSGWVFWVATTPLSTASPVVAFDIRPGSGLRATARTIADAGLPLVPWQFVVLGKLSGKESNIKAGSYEVNQGVTPWRLLEKLTRGDVTQSDITFVEGITFRQLRTVLDAHPDVQHETTGWTDAEILTRLGAVEAHPEGLFFPDTYVFAKQGSDLAILQRSYQSLQKHLRSEWERRDSSLPYRHPYQALIMASIVEKETGRPNDRPQVAAVFVNRLRRGMLLQTDPTVIYGMGNAFDGNLRKRDLLTDTPYNTYTRAGLPPTPIALPGLASIRVALSPPVSDKFYFVARGDGSSEFSRTLEEHNRAVNHYQRKK
ncbi:MAG: endolytic transglycosylase MltG [Rhodocyclaceae bacterium]|nr:endolytic transglycosylase MltG [Rhodocyclaceae bacterium]